VPTTARGWLGLMLFIRGRLGRAMESTIIAGSILLDILYTAVFLGNAVQKSLMMLLPGAMFIRVLRRRFMVMFLRTVVGANRVFLGLTYVIIMMITQLIPLNLFIQ
jgi:hypothetical protein